jgi:hypothetical protein
MLTMSTDLAEVFSKGSIAASRAQATFFERFWAVCGKAAPQCYPPDDEIEF